MSALYDDSLPVREEFASGEVLDDWDGDGTVHAFAFTSAVQFVEVHCAGGEGRCDPYGGTPAISKGIRCGDDIPRPISVPTSTVTVKVFASTGTTVTVHGARYTAMVIP